jgi:hypothetical protein
MITVFEKIPDLFVEIYDPQFQTWAAEFRRRGPKQAIVFRPIPGEGPQFDEEGRIVKAGAWLKAEVDCGPRPAGFSQNPRIIISPATPHDEELIARHTRAMAGHVLH